MAAAADDNTAQRRDIAEIPSPGDRDVIGADAAIVGGVEIDPTERRTIDRDPGMRGVRADQRRAVRIQPIRRALAVVRALRTLVGLPKGRGLALALALALRDRVQRCGAQIAADVARCQAARAQAGDHDVREILTN